MNEHTDCDTVCHTLRNRGVEVTKVRSGSYIRWFAFLAAGRGLGRCEGRKEELLV